MPTARQAGIRPRERVNNGKNAGDDGQKVLLAIKSMGGESAEAWRSVLDDLTRRGLRRPEFLSSTARQDATARSLPFRQDFS